MSDIDFDDIPAETPLSPEEAILRRHRREKKELQGKIVALKKSTSKNDKKKKKDLADEIAKMESELEHRHKLELSTFKPQSGEDKDSLVEDNRISTSTENTRVAKPAGAAVTELTSSDSCPPSPGGTRRSKAQKRREKKAAVEKERQVRIDLETAELQQGADWKLEDEKLVKLLEGLNLGIHDIPSDGHCLYRALSHQLGLVNHETSFEDLREQTSKYLENNKEEFIHYFDGLESTGENSYETYCAKVATTAAWGGDMEIRALSQILKKPIRVIQAEGPPLIFGEEFQSDKDMLTLTYHRHKFKLGAHYNSTVRSES